MKIEMPLVMILLTAILLACGGSDSEIQLDQTGSGVWEDALVSELDECPHEKHQFAYGDPTGERYGAVDAVNSVMKHYLPGIEVEFPRSDRTFEFSTVLLEPDGAGGRLVDPFEYGVRLDSSKETEGDRLVVQMTGEAGRGELEIYLYNTTDTGWLVDQIAGCTTLFEKFGAEG